MAIFNLNFLLKVGQVEMCQNPSPISTFVMPLLLENATETLEYFVTLFKWKDNVSNFST